MNKLYLVLPLLLSACATAPKIVYVSVAKPCIKAVIPNQPHYPIYDLKTGDNASVVLKSYVASMQMCLDYNKMCQEGRNSQ